MDWIFKTKLVNDALYVRNGQPVQIIDREGISVTIRFPDGKEATVFASEIGTPPDHSVGCSEMHDYGYSWEKMLPLTQGKAFEMWMHELPIYRLYADNTEALVVERKEIVEHDGLFGIEKGDWEQYLKRQDACEESAYEKESKLLVGDADMFGIYQLNSSPESRELLFMPVSFWQKRGCAVSRRYYELIYTAPLEKGIKLEDIYMKFNLNHPKDFTGHSLSVSDVVVLHRNGETHFHFVDSIGYREVMGFMS